MRFGFLNLGSFSKQNANRPAPPDKVERHALNVCVDALCLGLLLACSVLLVVRWDEIPQQIPTHYSFAGEVDGYGGKGGLITMLALSWLLFVGISVLERFPKLWNTGVQVTPENQAEVYRLLLDMVSVLKLLCVAVFVFLLVFMACEMPLPGLFTPIYMLLIFGELGYYLFRLAKAGKNKS
jgi:uncharacterized membrane protein